MGILTGAFQQVLGAILQTGRDPEREDVVEEMCKLFRAQLSNLEEQRRAVRKTLGQLQRLAGRFTVKGDAKNLPEEILTNSIVQAQGQLAQLEKQGLPTKEALTYLESVAFRREANLAGNLASVYGTPFTWKTFGGL